MNIIKSLNLDANEFFNDIEPDHSSSRVQIKRKEEYHPFEKEQAEGFVYHRIMTRNVRNLPIDIVLLELKRGANRTTMVKTDAYEYKKVKWLTVLVAKPTFYMKVIPYSSMVGRITLRWI